MASKCVSRILFLWGLLVIVAALFGKVAVADDNGQTVADFLNISVDARSASVGGAFTAVADGPSAMYWNPAGLAWSESPQISLSHFSWYQDINYEHLAISVPVGDKLALAGGATYLNYGDIDGYDEYDNPISDIGSSNDLALTMSGAYMINDMFSGGFSIKYVNLNLAGTRASVIAGDLGLTARYENYTFGASLANLGQKIKFASVEEDLPVHFRLGAAASWMDGNVITSTEYDHGVKGNSAWKNGVEYGYESRYFVRMGYDYQMNSETSLAGGVSFGAGAAVGSANIDYAYSPGSGVSSDSIHRFTVRFMFGN